MKQFFNILPVLTYFFKSKPEAKGNFNLRAMHFINRLAIVMFLIGVIVVIARNI